MYTEQILQTGLNFLNITDPVEIIKIRYSNLVNILYLAELDLIKKNEISYNNRFKIPSGRDKKEYDRIIKITTEIITKYKLLLRNNPESIILENEFNGYINKKKRLQARIHYQFNNNNNNINVNRAKKFPISELIDFRGGFTKCIFHTDNDPSMKYYEKNNRVHCFAGCGGFDVIDVYRKLYNVNFIEAVKYLSQ